MSGRITVKRSGYLRLAASSALLLVLSLVVVSPVHPEVRSAGPVNLSLAPDPATAGQAGGQHLSAATDPVTGAHWAVWEANDGHGAGIYYSRWSGREWQPAQTLSAHPEVQEQSPSLAFARDNATGRVAAWAAWETSEGPEPTGIFVSHWTGDRWSAPAPVPGTRALAGRQPALASASDGSLWLAWAGHDGTDREIFVSRRDGSGWSDPQRVGNDDTESSAYDTHPHLAVDPAGKVWVVWASNEGFLNDEIHASHWDGTAWSPQQAISTADDTPDVWPSIAMDASGHPWVAWQGVAMEGGGNWRIYTSHWDALNSAWHAEELVSSSPALEVEEERPSLALDTTSPDGSDLHLTWVLSGQISGVGHSTWDGTSWTTPTWRETSEEPAAPVLLTDAETWILWLAPEGPEGSPLMQENVEALTDVVPRSLPSRPRAPSGVTDFVPNRHLAHGDSITCGCYNDADGQPATPYPVVLEEMLDSSVGPSEVINSGMPGEKARAAEGRLLEAVQAHQPQFVLILEGTNDISFTYSPAETAFAVRKLIWIARDRSGIPGIQVVISKLIPRLDARYDDADEVNRLLETVARREWVPLADPWQAFHDYGRWQDLLVVDDPENKLHANSEGLRIIAETFYQTMVDAGLLPEDALPPTAQITSLPSQSECPTVSVAWEGDDGDGSGVSSFDVQVQDNGAAWTDWLVETPERSGAYTGAQYNHFLGFRVRARDRLGNVGDYSAAATTRIVDTKPPDAFGLAPLPTYQIAPFTVSWWGQDSCSPVTGYDVEYRVGTGAWTSWLTRTSKTSDSFDPDSPQCGQVYSFRVRAYDGANNISGWSTGTASTTLACHSARGYVRTVRETPVYRAQSSADPAALGADLSDGMGLYTTYFGDAGNYNIQVERHGFGPLPARQDVNVTGNVTGLDFYLPPLDDQVDNGGFEESGWGQWNQAGSKAPTLTGTAHTGEGAALLDAGGGDSRLSQSLTVPVSLIDPTLSLMVRLADQGGPASTLTIRMVGTTTESATLPVTPGDWQHAWYPASALAGETISLTLTVSGAPAVIVDEVSLGSALPGVYNANLPIMIGGGPSGAQ